VECFFLTVMCVIKLACLQPRDSGGKLRGQESGCAMQIQRRGEAVNPFH